MRCVPICNIHQSCFPVINKVQTMFPLVLYLIITLMSSKISCKTLRISSFMDFLYLMIMVPKVGEKVHLSKPHPRLNSDHDKFLQSIALVNGLMHYVGNFEKCACGFR